MTAPSKKTVKERELKQLREMLATYQKQEQMNKMVLSYILREPGVASLFKGKTHEEMDGVQFIELCRTQTGYMALCAEGLFNVKQETATEENGHKGTESAEGDPSVTEDKDQEGNIGDTLPA